ncbi:MAG: 2-oxoacid:ferredoxin oxidoreductase subunit beta [Defluviitaleaceae bacterium]|nr:2-oxoacid:ferredoxin oxidoreductase subunit beta [Defluviitaleaceae bacterium]
MADIMASNLIRQTFRTDKLPHIWCQGCGHGVLMRAAAQAILNVGFDPDKVCIVSGIGCSSRAPGYMNYNTLHTTHGRAIAFATGVKLAKPELHVIVMTGDGDAAAIGGNHFIHAARRNIGITTIVFNNSIYGMTGGQYSPTTPMYDTATTAPYGNIEQTFDLCKLADASGASYVARTTAYHVPQAIKIFEKALLNKGFSVVDAISGCPTYYGRKNKKGNAVQMMKWMKDNSIDFKTAEKMTADEIKDKIITGEYKNAPAPEYCEIYQKEVIDKVLKGDAI